MKIRQFATAAVLTLVLSISTLAGELWIPGVTNPPPPGEGRPAINTPQTEITGFDALTETARFLCLRMLSLV